MKENSKPFLTVGEVKEWFKNALRYNSTETTVAMHQCKKLDGYCIKVVLITDHSLCEEASAQSDSEGRKDTNG